MSYANKYNLPFLPGYQAPVSDEMDLTLEDEVFLWGCGIPPHDTDGELIAERFEALRRLTGSEAYARELIDRAIADERACPAVAATRLKWWLN